MEDKIDNSGKELLDMDEKGNPIVKKEKEKTKNVSSNIYKYSGIIIIIFILLGLCFYFLNKNANNKGVFDETTLKNLKLKNRVFFGAIIHDLEKIEKIAQNDVALIITDGAIVGDLPPNEKVFRVDKDEYIEELKKLPETVHKYNSYILLDLVHLGLHSPFEPVYSPSGDKTLQKGIQSNEMTKEDILRVQDFFVQGAIRAKKAGYDGIEIHAGHLTLCSSFLSKKFNRRNDDYGGSDEKRARFLVEIVKKIREAVGNDMIIFAKIDGVDKEFGFTESGFLTAGKMLEEVGVDLIEVSGANPIKQGDIFFYNDTKKLAEKVNIPVTCIGGIKTYEHADYVLKNSKIEYVALSRTLLKEPDLIKKWPRNK